MGGAPLDPPPFLRDWANFFSGPSASGAFGPSQFRPTIFVSTVGAS